MDNQPNLLSLPTPMASSPVSTGSWTTWGREAPYHGASRTRQAMKAWNPSNGSADRDAVTSLPILRARSRDLVRNVPVASAAILTMTTNVVGTGLKVRPRINAELLGITQEEADLWQARARSLFDLWGSSKNCDAERKNNFPQLQDLALRTMLVAGDCFALTPFRYTPASPFALTIKLLDGDRCRNPTTSLESDDLAGGVEVDEFGAPVAYHFTGKPENGMAGDLPCLETVRVPAFGETSGRPLVLHLFHTDRPDQRRGIPWLAPVVEVIKQQGRYQDAEIMAAVVSGMFTVFVKTPTGSPEWDGNVKGEDKVERLGIPAEGNQSVELKYGGVVDLAEGEDISFANPSRPNPNYDPFVNSIFREIGAGLGVPYEVMLKYFSSSYTAARAAFMEGWKTFRRARMDLAVDFLQPVYETALMEFISLGLLQAPGFFEDPLRRALWCQSIWVGDAPGQLDPLKETQAQKLQVDEQFKDRDTATVEINGGDYQRTVHALAREKAIRLEAGLDEPGEVIKTANASIQTTGSDVSQEEPTP